MREDETTGERHRADSKRNRNREQPRSRQAHRLAVLVTAIDMILSYENKLGTFRSLLLSFDTNTHAEMIKSIAIRGATMFAIYVGDVRIISELLQVDVHRASFARIASEQIPLGDKPAARRVRWTSRFTIGDRYD